MRDINLFSVYSRRKHSSLLRILASVLVIAAIVVVIGGAYFALYFHHRKIQNETAQIDAYLRSDEVLGTVAAVDQYSRERTTLEKYEAIAEAVLENLKAGDLINSARLEQISAALPADVVLNSISVSDNNVNFVFFSPDVSVTAQLVYSLSNIDFFDSVSLSGVQAAAPQTVQEPEEGEEPESPGYTVGISAILKGGEGE
ncbi:MAG: GerMN domain-containing protein [Clostridiales bacterium]|nr:GerMN domain-containing protein [Clostridiales bacterium]